MANSTTINIAFVAFSALSFSALAATPQQQVDDQAQQLQRQQRDRLEQEQREELLNHPKTIIQIETPSTKNKTNDDNSCRNISSIVLEGASLLSESTQKKLTTSLIKPCLKSTDIESLLGKITQYYIEKGFITTRAYIKAQDLRQGTLKISVVEGKVEKLVLEDGEDNDSVNLYTSFPTIEGRLFNLRDIEQGLDQINRISSNHATMEIRPGSDVGQSIVVIRNQRTRRLHGNLTYDNLGSSNTGISQIGFNAALDNPLHLNDSFNFTHRRTVEHEFAKNHSRMNNFMYTIPFGYATITATHTRSDYATLLRPPGGELIADGTTKSSTLSADYAAYRDSINVISLNSTFTIKTSNNYLAGQYLSVASRTLSSASLGSTWTTRLFNGGLSLNANHTWGLGVLSSMKDPDGLPEFAPRAQYSKWNGSINWMRPFQVLNQPFIFNSALTGQYSKDVLYGADQMMIGNYYSVRGYRNTSIAGDIGYFCRNDLSMPIRTQISEVSMLVKPYIGYDVGKISSRYTNTISGGQIGGSLSGMSLGVNVTTPAFNFDVSGMKPVSLPSNLQNEGLQVFARLSINL